MCVTLLTPYVSRTKYQPSQSTPLCLLPPYEVASVTGLSWWVGDDSKVFMLVCQYLGGHPFGLRSSRTTTRKEYAALGSQYRIAGNFGKEESTNTPAASANPSFFLSFFYEQMKLEPLIVSQFFRLTDQAREVNALIIYSSGNLVGKKVTKSYQ